MSESVGCFGFGGNFGGILLSLLCALLALLILSVMLMDELDFVDVIDLLGIRYFSLISLSSSINVKYEFVKANKLCWNCLGKGHNIKNCQSKHRSKVANCNKRHHTLLHNDNVTPPPATNPPPPVHQGPPNNPNDTVTSNHFKLSKTFLQILPVYISSGTKIVATNALLDTGSIPTLIHEDFAKILNLQHKNKTLEIGNAVVKSSNVQSKIVLFSVSSSSHPEKVALDNAFVVPNLNVKYHKVNMNKMKFS